MSREVSRGQVTLLPAPATPPPHPTPPPAVGDSCGTLMDCQESAAGTQSCSNAQGQNFRTSKSHQCLPEDTVSM